MYAVQLTENIRKNKIDNTRTSLENNIVNESLCAFRFTFKMSKETAENICLQDELPIVLITTFIKMYHVYKDRWISKESEHLNVFMEPDNPKDAVVCVKVNKNCWAFKERCSGKICENIFFSFCGVIHTNTHLCKSLTLEMERACKSLAE